MKIEFQLNLWVSPQHRKKKLLMPYGLRAIFRRMQINFGKKPNYEAKHETWREKNISIMSNSCIANCLACSLTFLSFRLFLLSDCLQYNNYVNHILGHSIILRLILAQSLFFFFCCILPMQIECNLHCFPLEMLVRFFFCCCLNNIRKIHGRWHTDQTQP